MTIQKLSLGSTPNDGAGTALRDGGQIVNDVVDAVMRPVNAGRVNGWPDPFFQTFDLTSQTFFGRDRWYWNGSLTVFSGWTLVPNAVFNGNALRRTANTASTVFSGPSIWLDEIGAVAGDEVTVYVLFSGDGAEAHLAARFTPGTQIPANPESVTGASTVVTSADAQWLRYVVTVPSGATTLDLYPYTPTADKTFDVVAVWAFKGDATMGPEWPTLPDGVVTNNTARIGALEDSFGGTEAKLDYAIGSVGGVSASATVIELDVTSPGTAPRDLPFMGWGEQYSPAGVSFNALRIKSLTRTPGTAAPWRNLSVVVRTGATAGASGDTLVAVGTTTVSSSQDTLSNVTIILRDPTTGAVKTLTDADFNGGMYFIGVYAQMADGTRAACGEPHGTMSNTLGQSYYYASSDNAPTTGAWAATAGASNLRMGFQHLLMTDPQDILVFEPTDQFVADVAGSNSVPVPEIVLPPTLFGVQGREMNVYLDNLHLGDASMFDHNIDSTSSLGQQQNERFTWVPAGALSSGTLSVTVIEKTAGTVLGATKTAQLRAAAASAGSGLTKKVIVVGDSLVDSGVITQTLLDIAGADVMGIELIGTQGQAPNSHEGRGGWTIADYTGPGPVNYLFNVSGVVVPPDINSSQYSNNGAVYKVQSYSLSSGNGTITVSVVSGGAPSASGTLVNTFGGGDSTITFSSSSITGGNPFWISGALNFPQYLANAGLATPDWVFIALGINDVFGATSDDDASSAADSAFLLLDTLIASIQSAGSSIKIGLMIPTPPPGQDAFGQAYGTGQPQWRDKRNILIWARQLIAKYAGSVGSLVYLVPSNTALDTVNNMAIAAPAPVNSRNSTNLVSRQINGVHPGTPGYQQIADAVWAFLKYYA